MSSKVRIRGARRKRKPEGSADWDAIGALMTLQGMTEEEEARFRWSHPELEGFSRGPSTATTDGQRSYEIYRRLQE
jgi:hypothetical protein